MLQPAPRHNGFSLVEILIVSSGVTLGLTAAAPRFSVALHDARVRAAGRHFIALHSLAKATAATYRRTTELHIDAAGGRVWIEVDTSRTGGVRDTVRGVQRVARGAVDMKSDRTLVCFDPIGTAVTFGSCEDGALRVMFASGSRTETVTTSVLGKVLRLR